ncbi:ankyrin repeat-containing protein NPR4-like [Olea europaea var. sylvestris]|uniref:ankyrin repeat-containing protein NPR4-like n=1 Tax=Olea europaea var. sylvestris TaxID=158386 RepID=UPI000C1CEB13|nr:ankyrin repeat-containing protein NPR4-like [Olea europaea var. sylvestris]
MAALMGKEKMFEYLHDITPINKDFKAKEHKDILVATIDSDMYGMESLFTTRDKMTMKIIFAIVSKLLFLYADIALKILEADRSIDISPDAVKGSALHALAQKTLSHYGTSQEWICEKLERITPYVPCKTILFIIDLTGFKRVCGSIQMRKQANQLVKELCAQLKDWEISVICSQRETPMLTDAAKIGNVEFLTLLIRSYPDLIWKADSNGAIKDLLMSLEDKSENNILHLAAELPPSSRLNIVSGATLQMQRELLWIKRWRRFYDLLMFRRKILTKKTPRELFTDEHEKLRVAGEKWMKDPTTSYMVVATLIATVVFAAAFTVPGRHKEVTGAPIFLNDKWFIVFVTSDAVAMFSSTASIMMFWSILTSCFGEDDFLFTLPAKLMGGLVTLFASVICMVLTFSTTFFLVYKKEKEGTLPKIVAGLALLPIYNIPIS